MGRPAPGPEEGGTLYIVSTPIGNLADITLRAIETLQRADVVLAEDTRASRVLLDHYAVRTKCVSAHEHNEARIIPAVLERLARGERVALITDAGTPLISDPGRRIVEAVRAAGHRVTPVPGPSALTAALAAAGLDTSRFTFLGFLPRSGRDRAEALALVSGLPHTGVLYEAPGRVAATLRALRDSGGGERRCVVAREISKKFEEFRDGTVGELAAYYADHPPRGEIVILVAGMDPKPMTEGEMDGRVKELRAAGLSAKDIAARLSAELGVPRNLAYRKALDA
ncbi:MAG TPA: 16S rRNA (cytidine(1402)-2'-O)-methyltransferase [Gemmatimonadaceae bacterium]